MVRHANCDAEQSHVPSGSRVSAPADNRRNRARLSGWEIVIYVRVGTFRESVKLNTV